MVGLGLEGGGGGLVVFSKRFFKLGILCFFPEKKERKEGLN